MIFSAAFERNTTSSTATVRVVSTGNNMVVLVFASTVDICQKEKLNLN